MLRSISSLLLFPKVLGDDTVPLNDATKGHKRNGAKLSPSTRKSPIVDETFLMAMQLQSARQREREREWSTQGYRLTSSEAPSFQHFGEGV